MSSKLVPEIRFKEFSGEWEERPILDIASMKARIGWQNLRQDEHLDSGEYYLITGTDFRDGIIDWDNAKYVEYERYIQDEYIILKEGDILITKDGSIGKLAYVENIKEKKATLNNGIFRIRVKNNDTKFIYYTFLSLQFKKFLEKLSAGSSINHLYQKDFKTYKIILPSSQEEQQKIADTLSSLDNLIEAQTKKVELLKSHKKGLMQKLFPRDGAKVPELRFKEFSGEWEEKKLGEILNSFRLGGNYKTTKTKNKYPLIKMGNIGRGKIKLNNLEYIDNFDEINKYDLLKYGDLLFNTRNTLELVGKVSIWKNELPVSYYNSNLMKIHFDNNFFINYLLNTQYSLRKIRAIATGTTSVAAIYTKDLLKIKIPIPPTQQEQQKIADTFSSLDNLIEAQTKKIELLKEHKKGLMQKMFVGDK